MALRESPVGSGVVKGENPLHHVVANVYDLPL